MHEIGNFGHAAQFFFKKYSIRKKIIIFPILYHKLET